MHPGGRGRCPGAQGGRAGLCNVVPVGCLAPLPALCCPLLIHPLPPHSCWFVAHLSAAGGAGCTRLPGCGPHGFHGVHAGPHVYQAHPGSQPGHDPPPVAPASQHDDQASGFQRAAAAVGTAMLSGASPGDAGSCRSVRCLLLLLRNAPHALPSAAALSLGWAWACWWPACCARRRSSARTPWWPLRSVSALRNGC